MPQSLPQSHTDTIAVGSQPSVSVFSDSFLTATTAQTEYTENSDSESSLSSNWDSHSIVSTVSTVLPPRQISNNIDIQTYHSQQYLVELKEDAHLDFAYQLYSLFYPFTNLQSLIFSHVQPYIETDYKKNKAFGNNDDDDNDIAYDDQIGMDTKMDWNDISSINRIKELMTKLLSSSSSNKGIKEEDIYLMFSSPSPTEIIEQLRFGNLSKLCDVHMDRFGRRTFHYHKHHKRNHERINSQRLYFFDHSSIPSTLFCDHDMVGLSDFITEDAESEVSDVESISSIATSIHYHDNDVVIIKSPKHKTAQIQWQNYAIHSYLHRKTRYAASSISSISSTSTIPSIRPQTMMPSMLPRKVSSNMKLGLPPPQKTNSFKEQNIVKEDFLERLNTKSVANVVDNNWVMLYCILWNKQMLFYKNKRNGRYTYKALGNAIDCIDLKFISLPIQLSFDAEDDYFVFRLNVVNSKKYHVFRTKTELARKSWVAHIESLVYYTQTQPKSNAEISKYNDMKSQYKAQKKADSTASCLVM